MKARIIVNRQIVQKNRKEGTDIPTHQRQDLPGPPNGCMRSGSPALPCCAAQLHLLPASSGATVWIETEKDGRDGRTDGVDGRVGRVRKGPLPASIRF